MPYDFTAKPYTEQDIPAGGSAGEFLSLDSDLQLTWVAVSPGSGATTFLQLTDTPSNYTGSAGKGVKVNAGGTALEFYTLPTAGTTAGTFCAGDDSRLSDSRTPTAHNQSISTITGLGTGVGTALTVNTGSAGAVILFNGALGTPSAGTLTHCTGLPLAGLATTGTANAGRFLRGDGAWSDTITALTVEDLTVGASGGSHGLGFLNGDGFYATLFSDNLTDDRQFQFPDEAGTLALKTSNNIVTESTTARALALTDEGKYIRLSHASGCAVTVPPNASVAFPVGTEIVFRRTVSAGAASITEGSGVTVNNKAAVSSVTAGSNFALKKVATNEWDFI